MQVKAIIAQSWALITVLAVPVFVALSLMSNALFKNAAVILYFGFPFRFYYKQGGYMAGHKGTSVLNLIIDLIFAWLLVALVIIIIQFFRKQKTIND